jgi:PAS domain-containing protein
MKKNRSNEDCPGDRAEPSLQEALKRIEEEKNLSEAIIAAIGDGISIQDTDFKVLYQNEINKKMIGDHVGEFCYQAYERRDSVCEECPVAMSFQDGEVHTVERSAPTERGTIFVEITSSPLRDASGKIIAGIEVARDISERKRMEVEREKLIRDLQPLTASRTRSISPMRSSILKGRTGHSLSS